VNAPSTAIIPCHRFDALSGYQTKVSGRWFRTRIPPSRILGQAITDGPTRHPYRYRSTRLQRRGQAVNVTDNVTFLF